MIFYLQSTLTQSQDKAFRRISELKEQIQLDQLAKQHIEENYGLMIEEKEELVKVLQTQVSTGLWKKYFLNLIEQTTIIVKHNGINCCI